MKVADEFRVLAETRFVALVSRGFEHGGYKGEWVWATRREVLPGQDLGRDTRAVVVIATVMDPEGGCADYVLNKEYRVPLGGWEIAFPAGLMDGDEGPGKAARRELAEETPYEVTEITDVSPALASSPGITDEMVHIVRCFAVAKEGGGTSLGLAEDIEVFLAKDTVDPRIPKGEGIVWSVRAWLELDEARRRNSGCHAPGG